MRLDVKTFIRECPCCQKMSQIKVPIQAYKYATSTYRPMECLNIDFIGPYPDKVPVAAKNCAINSFAKCEPLSDLIIVGLPYRPKCCIKHKQAS
jgi:hypothetical protein